MEKNLLFERKLGSANRSSRMGPIFFSAVQAASTGDAKTRWCKWIIGSALWLSWQPLGAQVAVAPAESISRNSAVSVPTTTIASLPLRISTSFAEGYDDNFRATTKAEGSWFTSGRASLSYALAREAMGLSLIAGGGAVAYTRQTDSDGFLNLSLNYSVSRRLKFDLDLSGSYQVEPDFGSDAGPSSRAGGFFDTSDIFSATYEWSQYWSSVSSYSFRLIRYDNSQTAAVTDRQENTFGEQVRYQWSRAATLVGEYRFETIDYVTAPRDSETNFILAGVDAQLSRRLKGGLRGGMTFRHLDSLGNTNDPHFEGWLDYAAGRDSTLRFTTSYSVEETGLQNAATRNTFRTGLQLIYGFTSRVRSTLSVDYHHDENFQQDATGNLASSFSEDAVAVSFGLSYQINRRLGANLGFDHSDVISDQAAMGYSRNRGSVGLSFTF